MSSDNMNEAPAATYEDFQFNDLTLSPPKTNKKGSLAMYVSYRGDEKMKMQYATFAVPMTLAYKIGNYNDEEGAVPGRVGLCGSVHDDAMEEFMIKLTEEVIFPHLLKPANRPFWVPDGVPTDNDAELRMRLGTMWKPLVKPAGKHNRSVKFKVDTIGASPCEFWRLTKTNTLVPIEYYDVEPRSSILVIGGIQSLYNLMGRVGGVHHAHKVVVLPTVSRVPAGFNLGPNVAAPVVEGSKSRATSPEPTPAADSESEAGEETKVEVTQRIDPVTMQVITDEAPEDDGSDDGAAAAAAAESAAQSNKRNRSEEDEDAPAKGKRAKRGARS